MIQIGRLIGVERGEASRDRAKLVEGARLFEAMLLGEMLKPLQFGAGPDEGGKQSSDGAPDAVRGFGTEAIAGAIAKGGGFGIARQIVQKVTREETQHGSKTGEVGKLKKFSKL